MEFYKLGDGFEIAYEKPADGSGWARFRIRRPGNRGFGAGYSINEHRFSRQQSFTELPERAQFVAKDFAEDVLRGEK